MAWNSVERTFGKCKYWESLVQNKKLDKWYCAYESTKQETMINDTGLMKVQNKKQW